MSFRKFADCGFDLQAVLKDMKLFREVRVAALAGYEQLYKLLPELRLVPAAVIVLGPVGYVESYGGRQFTAGIVIVDRLNLNADAKAKGIWDLMDQVLDIFEPTGRNDWVEIEDVRYIAQHARPLALGGDYAAYLLELDALAPMIRK